VNGVTNPSYTYDANGVMTLGAGRSVVPTSFNMARSITEGTTSTNLRYGPDHARMWQQTSVGGTLQTTIYLDDPASGAHEETLPATNDWHDLLALDGHLAAERFCTGAAPCSSGATWRWFVTDNLGSIAVATDATAAVFERDAYDPWGKRRNLNGTDDTACSLTSVTTRGFTGHEHMAALCEINANARIYDPTIGRFTSADSVVQSPFDSQSLNRYSYVENGPLSATDPTGHATIDPGDCGYCEVVPSDRTSFGGGGGGNGGAVTLGSNDAYYKNLDRRGVPSAIAYATLFERSLIKNTPTTAAQQGNTAAGLAGSLSGTEGSTDDAGAEDVLANAQGEGSNSAANAIETVVVHCNCDSGSSKVSIGGAGHAFGLAHLFVEGQGAFAALVASGSRAADAAHVIHGVVKTLKVFGPVMVGTEQALEAAEDIGQGAPVAQSATGAVANSAITLGGAAAAEEFAGAMVTNEATAIAVGSTASLGAGGASAFELPAPSVTGQVIFQGFEREGAVEEFNAEHGAPFFLGP
jgi:RHS repeat-associated protein